MIDYLLPSLYYVIIAIVTLCLSSILYDKFSSKTSHIPQPWSWPILKHLPYFWQRDDLQVYLDFAKPYKRQGGLFKINNLSLPEQVVLLDPAFPKYVLGRPDLFHRSSVIHDVCPFFKHGLLMATGQEHRRQKKILSRAFTPAMLNGYFEFSNKCADNLIQKWKNKIGLTPTKKGAIFEVLSDYQNVSFQVATNSLAYLEDELHEELLSAMVGALNLLKDATFAKVIWKHIPFLKYLPFGPEAGRKECIQFIDDTIMKVIETKKRELRENIACKNDLLTMLLRDQMKQSESALTDLEIRDNLVTFYIGGFDTTSSALTWASYALCKYPEVQEKLRREIFNIAQHADAITMAEISQMPYLDMVIKETLRLYNSSIRVGRIATQNCRIGDHWIPKGQMIKTVFNLFHTNEELFPEPEEFNPERFQDPRNLKVGSWLAFGYGPYSCIGKKFAINEIKVLLCKILLEFRLSIIGDGPEIRRKIKIALFNEVPIEVYVEPLVVED